MDAGGRQRPLTVHVSGAPALTISSGDQSARVDTVVTVSDVQSLVHASQSARAVVDPERTLIDVDAAVARRDVALLTPRRPRVLHRRDHRVPAPRAEREEEEGEPLHGGTHETAPASHGRHRTPPRAGRRAAESHDVRAG